jgi:hypothetical protein
LKPVMSKSKTCFQNQQSFNVPKKTPELGVC